MNLHHRGQGKPEELHVLLVGCLDARVEVHQVLEVVTVEALVLNVEKLDLVLHVGQDLLQRLGCRPNIMAECGLLRVVGGWRHLA